VLKHRYIRYLYADFLDPVDDLRGQLEREYTSLWWEIQRKKMHQKIHVFVLSTVNVLESILYMLVYSPDVKVAHIY
jgi:hypothetical protein